MFQMSWNLQLDDLKWSKMKQRSAVFLKVGRWCLLLEPTKTRKWSVEDQASKDPKTLEKTEDMKIEDAQIGPSLGRGSNVGL